MIKLHSLSLSLLAGAFLLPALSQGQSVKPAVRIVEPIDEAQLVTLKGNTNPHANAKNDLGAVSPSLSMPDLNLVLSRSAEQEAAFEDLIKSQYEPGSANYHQWLTPQQIGEQFGPSQTDIATITAWLTGHGFAVRSIAPDRMTIRFGGTAGQVQSAFHTEIHNLSVNGVAHFANIGDPQIPAALSPVIVGVKALHNFLPHPLHKETGQVTFNKQSGRWQRVASTTTAPSSNTTANLSPGASTTPAFPSGLHPQFGINVPSSSNSSAYLEEDVTPWDFATIYNVIPAWNAGITGSGQTVAIAGTSLISQSSVGSATYGGSGTQRSVSGSDVSTFRSDFGLPALSSFQQIDTGDGPTATVCNSTSPYSACGIGDLDENTLDVEWSGSVATGAAIALVVTGQNSAGSVDTVYDSAQYVVQNQVAKILNVSYGECELGQGTAENVAFYDLWQSAAAEGISVFVASGDSGAPSCDDGGDSIGWPYSAQYGLSVSGLASTPYNVAVGGTDFSWCKPTINSSGNIAGCPTSSSSQGSPAYWNSGSTSGNSSEPYESALGYVPEVPWNDTCLNPLLANYLSSFLSYLGYSGGSNPETTCNAIQKDWLAIAENQNQGYVLAPYIDTIGGSGGASNCVVNSTNPDSTTTGTCSAGANTTGTANGSIPLTNDGWQKPAWQTGVTGIPNDGVRDLPDVSFFAADGALNSAYLVCISADRACTYPNNAEETYEEFGGTSFASPEMAGVMALINQKSGAPQGLPLKGLYTLASEQNYASCSSETVSSSSSCYFQSIDEGTNAMPCDYGATVGGVSYNSYRGEYVQSTTYAGIISPNCTALNGGDTVGTLTTTTSLNANPSGVAYNATPGYNMATGLGSLNVYNVVHNWVSDVGTAPSTMNVVLSATSISANTALTITVTMTGSGSLGTPTGSISIAGGGYSANQALSGGSATIVIPANSLTPGSVTLTVTYSGDGNYASQSITKSVTVSAITPTVTVSAPASDNVANVVLVSVTVSGPGGSPTPAGTVSLSSGTYNSTAAQLSSAGVAYFSIPAGAIAVGSDTITATYSGTTSYYTTATGTATIKMVSTAPATATVTVTPNLASGVTSIDSAQSLSVTVSVSGASGVPTGSVILYALAGTAREFESTPVTLSSSSATVTIPASTLTAGTITLMATYSGDAVYAQNSSPNTTITVINSTYSLAATTPAAVSPGSPATSTISGNSSTYYTGTVTLGSCTLTSSSITSPTAPPICSASGTITFTNGVATGSGSASVTTYDEVASNQARPQLPGGGNKGWLGAGSGAILALLVFFGIPARRRSWRSMLSILIAMAAIGTLASCGGGSTNSGGGGTNYVTQAGTYTFTVTATGSDPAKTTETIPFTVTVN
jgi:hypothetical protein